MNADFRRPIQAGADITRKNSLIVAITLFVLLFATGVPAFPSNAGPARLKLVTVIGEQEGIFFSGISDAALTSDKHIVILDGRSRQMSLFDWNGTFLRRMGRQGSGPGDFSSIQSVGILENRIYVLDNFNFRIMATDMDFKVYDYIHLPKTNLTDNFLVTASNRFLIISRMRKSPTGNKIHFMDNSGMVSFSFFDQRQVEFNTEDNEVRMELAYLSCPTAALNSNRTRLLVSFITPANPIVFYLYDMEGKLLKTFNYKMDQYEFPLKRIRSRKKGFSKFKGEHGVEVKGLYHYGGHWYAFITTSYFPTGDYNLTYKNLMQYRKDSSFFIEFDSDGKLLGKFEVNPYFECFFISHDGYVLGKHPHSDAEELAIYKILEK